MSHPVLVLLRTGLAAEKLRPPLVEVDKVLGVLAPLGLILATLSTRYSIAVERVLTVFRRDGGDQPRRTYTIFQARDALARRGALTWEYG